MTPRAVWMFPERIEFPLVDGLLERGLFRFVQLTIMVRVIRCDLRVHLADMIEHHFGSRLVSMRRHVSRELHLSVDDGFSESLLFRCIELAILIGVE